MAQLDSAVPVADAIDTSCNNRYYVRLCSPQIRLGVPLKNRYLDSGFIICPMRPFTISVTRLTLRVTIAITFALLTTNPFGCAIPRPLHVQRSFLHLC